MGFVANFQQCKTFENWLRFDKVTESLKVGSFLRHSVEFTRQTNFTRLQTVIVTVKQA